VLLYAKQSPVRTSKVIVGVSAERDFSKELVFGGLKKQKEMFNVTQGNHFRKQLVLFEWENQNEERNWGYLTLRT
jgi:hypothetical protein